jgi:hypothetical protein
MSLRRLYFAPMIVALAACADATVPDARAPEGAVPRATLSSGWDITNQSTIPANTTCGHIAQSDGSTVVDWTVDGVLYAQDVSQINYTNTGSPYTLALGDYSGGVFTEYYSETFYPAPQGTRPAACLTVDEGV